MTEEKLLVASPFLFLGEGRTRLDGRWSSLCCFSGGEDGKRDELSCWEDMFCGTRCLGIGCVEKGEAAQENDHSSR